MSRGGDEYDLTSGALSAIVTQVGGGLRALRHGGRDLLLSYPRAGMRPSYSGSLLAPWPNRIADGRYEFADQSHQLPVNEPERCNALHGLVCWERFELRFSSPTAVTLGVLTVPREGYPFELDIEVTYDVSGDVLRTTVTARNIGAQPAPWGTGPHPYLTTGAGHVDDWLVQVPADIVLTVTPDRLLPTGTAPVEGTDLDLRGERRIGDLFLDHAFTGLACDDDGTARVTVRDADGSGVECFWDAGVLPWVQVHTADYLEGDTRRTGLAVEPMTCPPDAFNSHTDLVVLEPSTHHVASWTIAPLT